MNGPNPGKLTAIVLGLITISALSVLVKGGLYLSHFEGDAFHLADIVLRSVAGERAHLDFMTPLGALGFQPIVWFAKAGFPLGHAFVYGQVLFALVIAGPLIWAAVSRLSAPLAFGFALAVVALLTSLSHGQSGSIVAISMHYNRWAWAVAFIACLIAFVPPKRADRPQVDGVILAGSMAMLAYLKVTYLAAFAPLIILVLILRRDMTRLAVAVVAGLVLAVGIVATLGLPSVMAYIGDIQSIRGTGVRAAPGLDFADLLISPPYFVGVAAALTGAFLLRGSGARTEGLAILLLVPACVFVTWQNFGNDPVWLILLATLLGAYRPRRNPRRPASSDPSVGVAAAAFAAAVLAVPMVQNHAVSGLRMLTLDNARYTALVPGRAGLEDLYMPALPADLVRGRSNFTDPGAPYGALAERVPDHAPAAFLGETLPTCQIVTGLRSAMAEIAQSLGADETPIFVADLVSVHWLFGEGDPLPGGAPWTYGTLAGLEAAEHVLVPLCAIDVNARNVILERLETEGPALSIKRRTEQYLLYTRGG